MQIFKNMCVSLKTKSLELRLSLVYMRLLVLALKGQVNKDLFKVYISFDGYAKRSFHLEKMVPSQKTKRVFLLSQIKLFIQQLD